MSKHKKILVVFILLSLLITCKKDKPGPADVITPTPDTEVNVNLASVPYQKLSDYRFFTGDIKNLEPNSRVLPYEPISSLFTDYASKKRFVWMPVGQKAYFQGDGNLLDMPTGSVLIKTFYYNQMLPEGSSKILETRLMIKKSSGWIFAEYVWNEDQTEAYLDMNGSYKNISFDYNGNTKTTDYRLPSGTECMTCHKNDNTPIPIGIKPQHLNRDFLFGTSTMNQLQKWIDIGYLNGPLPNNIVSLVDYTDVSQPIDLRLRSYLDINCSHCHSEESHCDYRPMRLAFSETNQMINLGVCVEPEEFINASLINIITPGNYNKSMMYYRLNSTDESNRMPLLGRTLIHEEAVDILKQYILSISSHTCN